MPVCDLSFPVSGFFFSLVPRFCLMQKNLSSDFLLKSLLFGDLSVTSGFGSLSHSGLYPHRGFLCPILWVESKSCRRRHPSPSNSWFLRVWVCRALWFRSPLSIELHPSPRTFLATKLCPSLPANFSDPLGSRESFLNALLCSQGFRKVHGAGGHTGSVLSFILWSYSDNCPLG